MLVRTRLQPTLHWVNLYTTWTEGCSRRTWHQHLSFTPSAGNQGKMAARPKGSVAAFFLSFGLKKKRLEEELTFCWMLPTVSGQGCFLGAPSCCVWKEATWGVTHIRVACDGSIYPPALSTAPKFRHLLKYWRRPPLGPDRLFQAWLEKLFKFARGKNRNLKFRKKQKKKELREIRTDSSQSFSCLFTWSLNFSPFL